MFTGKNKEDFIRWFKKFQDENKSWFGFIGFYNLPFSMQQGVYLEYLDSVRVFISTSISFNKGYKWTIDTDEKFTRQQQNPYTTRQEALKEAFKKADELINSK